MVAGADTHEARREAVEIRERGRDLGRAALLVGATRQVPLTDQERGLRAQHVEAVVRALSALARRPAEVVDAEREIQPVDPVDRTELVAYAQRDGGREVRARGLAADEQPLASELGSGVIDEPPPDPDRAVRAGGP